jgi:uncharacterized protein
MKVVLDTNVLLTIISERSSIHDIFMAFVEEQYTLCVTTDILMEYEEVITRHMGHITAVNVLQIIENALNVLYINRYYAWHIIETDPDDNKFVDCAIAANAKYIVTGDRHFNIVKSIDFLKLSIITAYDLQKILKNQD